MPFACPACQTAQLVIFQVMEVLPDSRSDEITVQRIECLGCPFQGVAVYEESRRGAPDSESVDHYGYALDMESAETLFRYLVSCPDPHDPQCPCAGHQALGKRGDDGRWFGLEGWALRTYFQMTPAP